jgi:hypothetical protein
MTYYGNLMLSITETERNEYIDAYNAYQKDGKISKCFEMICIIRENRDMHFPDTLFGYSFLSKTHISYADNIKRSGKHGELRFKIVETPINPYHDEH